MAGSPHSLTALHGLRETKTLFRTYYVHCFPARLFLCSTAQKDVNYDAFVVFLSFSFSPSVRKEIKQQVSLVWFFFLFLRLTMLTLVPPTSDWMKKEEEEGHLSNLSTNPPPSRFSRHFTIKSPLPHSTLLARSPLLLRPMRVSRGGLDKISETNKTYIHQISPKK